MAINRQRDALSVLRMACRKVRMIRVTVANALERSNELRLVELLGLQHEIHELDRTVGIAVGTLQRCLAVADIPASSSSDSG